MCCTLIIFSPSEDSRSPGAESALSRRGPRGEELPHHNARCPIAFLLQTRRNHFGLASTGESFLAAFECHLWSRPLGDKASNASWIRYWRSITSGHLRAAERTSNFAFLDTLWISSIIWHQAASRNEESVWWALRIRLESFLSVSRTLLSQLRLSIRRPPHQFSDSRALADERR